MNGETIESFKKFKKNKTCVYINSVYGYDIHTLRDTPCD
jgi:hypothetical protein